MALRPKLYAYKQTSDKIEHKKCKGVQGAVVKKDIKFDDYFKTNFSKQNFQVDMNAFRSYKHQLYTEKITKNALSYNDDKCYILDDMVHTRTIGHYKNI